MIKNIMNPVRHKLFQFPLTTAQPGFDPATTVAKKVDDYVELPEQYSLVLCSKHEDQKADSRHYLFKLGQVIGSLQSNTQDLIEKSGSYHFDPRLVNLKLNIDHLKNDFNPLMDSKYIDAQTNYEDLCLAMDIHNGHISLYLTAINNF